MAGLDISGVTSPGFVFNGSVYLLPMCSQAGIWVKKRFRRLLFHGGV